MALDARARSYCRSVRFATSRALVAARKRRRVTRNDGARPRHTTRRTSGGWRTNASLRASSNHNRNADAQQWRLLRSRVKQMSHTAKPTATSRHEAKSPQRRLVATRDCNEIARRRSLCMS